jgi:predicted acyl esterase
MLRSIHTALSSGSPPAQPCSAAAAESRTWDQQVDTVEAFRELFTKHDHMIPMRDGVKLYTTLFVPKLVSFAAADSSALLPPP